MFSDLDATVTFGGRSAGQFVCPRRLAWLCRSGMKGGEGGAESPTIRPMRSRRSIRTNLSSCAHIGCNRSTVVGELVLRPGFSHPQSPNATDGAICATRREAWATGFDCGAGAVLLGVYAAGSVDASQYGSPRGGSSPLPSADPREGREGLKLMLRTEHDRAARGRGGLTWDRGSLRFWSS